MPLHRWKRGEVTWKKSFSRESWRICSAVEQECCLENACRAPNTSLALDVHRNIWKLFLACISFPYIFCMHLFSFKFYQMRNYHVMTRVWRQFQLSVTKMLCGIKRYKEKQRNTIVWPQVFYTGFVTIVMKIPPKCAHFLHSLFMMYPKFSGNF